MKENLESKFMSTIINGLRRKSVNRCSKWAESYRVMGPPAPGPYRFAHTPWTKGMHDSEATLNVGQKSAQAGYSETVLNRTFYKIDIEKIDCLYVLPSKTPDASDFSAARFDPALELSEHLTGIFSDVKNVGHKRAGTTNLYIRGSNARGGLKSVPVGFLVLDEFDEMTQENIPLAWERLSGQFSKQIWEISTPTAPNMGINKEFLKTTQEHFFFKCPSCSRHIELCQDNLKITGDQLDDPGLRDSHLFCLECNAVLPHAGKREFLATGDWQPTAENPEPDARGFYINQMYSATISPYEMAKAYLLALIDPYAEQEYFNSKMGLPHVVDGAELTDKHFAALRAVHGKNDPIPQGFLTMGVDVGKRLHYEIDLWNIDQWGRDLNVITNCQLVAEGSVSDFSELDGLMKQYRILMCVIDANPEVRKAFEFSQRFPGFVKLCYYSEGVVAKNIEIQNVVGDDRIHVDRTNWIDTALSRFYNNRIAIPRDLSVEYKMHLKNIKRIYKKDKTGNQVARYVNAGPDHFAHARTYAELALPLAAAKVHNRDIGAFL